MSTGILVKDLMGKKPVTAKPTDNILNITRTMKKNNIGMVIVTENHKPTGVVTRDDVLEKVIAENKSPKTTTARDIMSFSIVSCDPNDDIADISMMMVKYGFKRIPVQDKGRVLGVISYKDIIRTVPTEIETLRERLLIQPPIRVAETTTGECQLCGNFSEELQDVNDKWVCDACKEEAAEL